MIKSNRFTTGLEGADGSVDSVYNIPNIDPDYAVASLHYSNVPKEATEFRTTSIFYDPNRPITSTNSPVNPATGKSEDSDDGENKGFGERLFFDPFIGFWGNDGEEGDEKPTDNAIVKADDRFAITVLGLVFVGFIVARVIK